RGALAAPYGVRISFHHHTGVPFETYEETAQLLRDTDPQHVHLFCDTGHATKDFTEFPVARRAYELLSRHWDRLCYLEFKDWSPQAEFATDLGDGQADFTAIARLVVERGWDRWIVLEQNAPANGSTPRQSAARSLRFAQQLFARKSAASTTSPR
ncbi:MAG: TIM barrel protein, partial [Planctomycetes bacterium]|nr:TIM barrel protein [Planctomycetota bacterium]